MNACRCVIQFVPSRNWNYNTLFWVGLVNFIQFVPSRNWNGYVVYFPLYDSVSNLYHQGIETDVDRFRTFHPRQSNLYHQGIETVHGIIWDRISSTSNLYHQGIETRGVSPIKAAWNKSNLYHQGIETGNGHWLLGFAHNPICTIKELKLIPRHWSGSQ